MAVGMPASLWLHQFGRMVFAAFGEHPYHVGSSVREKLWRDVDVRVMLARGVYERMGLGDPKRPHANARWVAFCTAFSALGKQMTGLPIDFQIQEVDSANEEFGGGMRSALGFEEPDLVGVPRPGDTDAAWRQLVGKAEGEAASGCRACGSRFHFTQQHDDAVADFTAALQRAKATP